MTPHTLVPNLVIAQRVLDKMLAAASHYVEDETGEAMVGFILPGERLGGVPTIYVIDTISPDDSAVRQLHTFQQGDERQDELIWWLQENWHRQRERHKNDAPPYKWDVPLRYLGDWHKQPGYMIAPSGGDLLTALDWLDDPDNNMEALLVPIVTLGHPATTAPSSAAVNYLTVPTGNGEALRVDWWYVQRNGRVFQPINPVVYPSDQLPTLAQYPWHLVNQARASEELIRLQADGLFVSLVLWEVNPANPMLDVCLLMARQGMERLLIVATEWDFPHTPPRAWTAPLARLDPDEDMYDVFDEAWGKAAPVTLPSDWRWTVEKTLLEFVHEVERRGTPAANITRGDA